MTAVRQTEPTAKCQDIAWRFFQKEKRLSPCRRWSKPLRSPSQSPPRIRWLEIEAVRASSAQKNWFNWTQKVAHRAPQKKVLSNASNSSWNFRNAKTFSSHQLWSDRNHNLPPENITKFQMGLDANQHSNFFKKKSEQKVMDKIHILMSTIACTHGVTEDIVSPGECILTGTFFKQGVKLASTKSYMTPWYIGQTWAKVAKKLSNTRRNQCLTSRESAQIMRSSMLWVTSLQE